jgi:hypothetical protein
MLLSNRLGCLLACIPYGTLRVLLCCILKQVLEVVGLNKSSLERYIGPMIRWAAHAPVAETLIIKLVRHHLQSLFVAAAAVVLVSHSGRCSSRIGSHVSSSSSSGSCVSDNV